MKPNYLVLYKCCHLFSIVTQISKSKRFCLEQSVEHLNMHLDYSYFNCGKDLKSNLFVPVWISNRNPLLWLQRRSISRFFLASSGIKRSWSTTERAAEVFQLRRLAWGPFSSGAHKPKVMLFAFYFCARACACVCLHNTGALV